MANIKMPDRPCLRIENVRPDQPCVPTASRRRAIDETLTSEGFTTLTALVAQNTKQIAKLLKRIELTREGDAITLQAVLNDGVLSPENSALAMCPIGTYTPRFAVR